MYQINMLYLDFLKLYRATSPDFCKRMEKYQACDYLKITV